MSNEQSALTKEEFSETMTDLFSYLQENMATKDDVRELRTELKGDIEDLRTEMHAGFQMLERELVDIRQSLSVLEKRTQEDSDAHAGDILRLTKRLEIIEKEFELFKKQKETA
jgi:CII-binding regulator of phage lambda lysogenization HflD